MTQARAAVVTGEEETRMTELIHHLDHVLGHDAHAVTDVVGTRIGQRGIAIAA
jgi:hypothetical protein